MKKHLISLLLEQFKLECWITELEKLGIEIHGSYCKNLDIILNIIGFPPDNSIEYDWNYENSDGEVEDPSKKKIDDKLFVRDYLIEPYYELTRELFEKRQIVVTEEGLSFENQRNDNLLLELFGGYVDWLYKMYDEHRNETPE